MELVSSFQDRFSELTNGQTYQEVADRLGVAKSTIGTYLKGEVVPKQTFIQGVAREYGVSGAWLMGYDAPKYDDSDDSLSEYLDVLRTRPECRMLFSLAKDATKEDVERAVAVIEALKGK